MGGLNRVSGNALGVRVVSAGRMSAVSGIIRTGVAVRASGKLPQ